MTFRFLDCCEVQDGSATRRIVLYEGDLSKIPKEHRADILVVSAFAGDYTPSPTSLIGDLDRSGLSVGLLSRSKAHDLTSTCGFWISKPIEGEPASLNIGQIACFEPSALGSAPTVVGNLFRGLFPFLDPRKNQVVAMPILAAGDQGNPPQAMLFSMLDAATHWLARGLPISELMIVVRDPIRAKVLATTMADFKARLSPSALKSLEARNFDVFLSFSSKDIEAADLTKAQLRKKDSLTNVFDFRLKIDTGKSWQGEIDRAISSCKTIVAILSPSYFASPNCQEELMQARLRNKRLGRAILFPIYWISSENEMPLWLQLLNYADCRERSYEKLASAVNNLSLSE